MRIILLLVLAFLAFPSFADKDVPHPVTEKQIGRFQLPSDISNFSDDRLVAIKEEYLQHLRHYEKLAEIKKEGRDDLLEALRLYDEERAKIVEVIPELIKAYRVDKECADKMRAYAKRFAQIHNNYNDSVQKLSDYKSYDFRLGITYVSLMRMLEEYPEVYNRLMRDLDDEKSVIGQYVKRLDGASKVVENVSNQIEEIHTVRELESIIKKVEEELLTRIADN